MLDPSANAIEDLFPTHPIAKGDQRIRAQEIEIQQKSFKQVLLDPKFNEKLFDSDADSLSTDDELMSDGEMEDLPEADSNLNTSIPRVLLPQSLLKKIRRPWKDCLIVKLMGMSIGYKALLNRVKRLWEIQGDLEAVDLGLGFFLLKFEVKSDFTKVFTGGPWVILDHCLTVRKWKADFKPSVAEDISTAVWVRFPQLPIEYYNEKVLFHIAKLIGKPIKVDLNTATTTRGRYARVCVEINLGNPLTSQFAIGKYVYNIEYEHLHLFCFSCGRVGHRQEHCGRTPTTNPDKSTAAFDNTKAHRRVENSASAETMEPDQTKPGMGRAMDACSSKAQTTKPREETYNEPTQFGEEQIWSTTKC
ncbi:hypothetical protein CsSME_00023486 [Camellia sinensis var. sinensis]